MPIVQFAPFSSLVQPTFWHELTRLKIDVLKLSDESVPIGATYAPGKTITDRETGQEVALGCTISVGGDSFGDVVQPPPNAVVARGVFKNYNTIEEFKAADKTAMFHQLSDEIWKSIQESQSTEQLNQFLLLTFADLKKYRYYYWFAFPAFAAKPAWEIQGEEGWRGAGEVLGDTAMASIYEAIKKEPRAYFLARPSSSEKEKYEVAAVEEYTAFFANVPSDSQVIGFLDPSAQPQNPGWPLRNLLAFLRAVQPATTVTLRVLAFRDTASPSASTSLDTTSSSTSAKPKAWRSRFGVLEVGHGEPGSALLSRPTSVGWERDAKGRMAARVADLAPMMDPVRLADQAVDLNLKLMRWRILPALDLDKVAGTRCLLLGAGTLGCYVARSLMGWGVRTITFVDSGTVSFSNPVRQPLFEFEDCLDGGKPKAECAAMRLRKVFPGVNATGHKLAIPMPGHPIPPGHEEDTRRDVQKLEVLIDAHDAVFLLMDSRESRWLPSVMGAAKGKIVMNAALGFDTYLVMRHGARSGSSSASADAPSSTTNSRLGCYYCNDIVAPSDSLTDRTLDQMCTVTRPGLAAIASATAVELLASLVQHPDGINAPAPEPTAYTASLSGEAGSIPGSSVLGLVPHQLRGFLAQFRTMPVVGAAYDKCTACSETVLKAYEAEGFDMMLKAFNEVGYLESLTGLDKMYDETNAVMEAVEMDGEEDDF